MSRFKSDPLATGTLALARELQPRVPVGFTPVSLGGRDGQTPGALLTDTGEGHLLVIAPTGQGKGRCVLIPQALTYRGPLFLIDPKAEALFVTGRQRVRMGQSVHFLDPWNVAAPLAQQDWAASARATINPLEVMLKHSVDLCDDCMTLTETICDLNANSTPDPFWVNAAKDLITAAIGWAWVRPLCTGVDAADDGTIGAVYDLLTADDVAYEFAVILDTHGKKPAFPAWLYALLASFLAHEAEKVRSSVRSEAVAMMHIFASPRMREATSRTTFPMERFQAGEPVSIYLVVPPDRLESHAAYVRIVLATLLSLMTRRLSRAALPTLFLVDEMGHLGRIAQLKQAVTLLRGYGVRVGLFVQSLSQLKGLWPQDWETIIENCGTVLNFGNSSMAAARQVADQFGDLGAEALFRMSRDQLAVHQAGRAMRIARRLDYLTDPLFSGSYDPNPYYQPASRPAADQRLA